MQSCLYTGDVRHSRLGPVAHEFRYRMSWLMIDLDETDMLRRRGLLSRTDRGAAALAEGDHQRGAEGPLADAVRSQAAKQLGRRSRGPVRMLTQLRHFGLYFSREEAEPSEGETEVSDDADASAKSSE